MAHEDAALGWRRLSLIESLLIAAIGLYVLVFTVVFALMPYPAGSFFGWNVASDGTTVSYVTPGSSVANAGIRVGDRIDWATLPLLMRTNLGAVEPTMGAGSVVPVTILHGDARRTVRIRSKPWPNDYQTAVRIQIVVIFVLCAIALALVWLRPSLMTWGFLLYEVFGQTAGAIAFAQSNALHFLLLFGAIAVFSGASLAGLLIFVSRFPTDRAHGARRIFDRLAIPLGVAVTLLALTMYVFLVVSPGPPPQWLTYTNQQLLPTVSSIVALVALILSARFTSGNERQRVLPLLAAMALSVVIAAINNVLLVFVTGGVVFTVVGYLAVFAQLLIGAAVAHGVIRHHVFDISFTLSRTLVYSIITTIIVGTFALIDFASGKLLDQLRITIVLETAAALFFGLTINALHSRIDHFVDRVLFRRRYTAEKRLKRIARTIAFSESAQFVDETLVLESMDALDLASVALFRQSGHGYMRARAEGWDSDHVGFLASDDHLVTHLAAELDAVNIREIRWPQKALPSGNRHPALAIPLVVRRELIGFTFYSGHSGGEAIDPDELVTLMHLTEAAAAAYEHIAKIALTDEANQLRTKNEILEHEQRLLREMVDALREQRSQNATQI